MSEVERYRPALQPRYEVHSTVGRGELGLVLAGNTAEGLPVAIKLLSRDAVAMMTSPAAFVAEIERAAGLHHPALVPLHGAGITADGDVYYVMGLVDGPTGRDIGESDDRPSAREIALAGARLADALSAAHTAGLVHGLIAPANLHWTANGVQLADLGVYIALAAAGITGPELPRLFSTPQYMSPEQLSGESIDGRSDIYSLGATLYELVTGRPPFGGRTTSTVMVSVLAGRPAASDDDPEPKPLVDAVLRAIEKAPDDRWPSAAAFAAALRDDRLAAAPAPQQARRLGCLPAAAIFLVLSALRLVRGVSGA